MQWSSGASLDHYLLHSIFTNITEPFNYIGCLMRIDLGNGRLRAEFHGWQLSKVQCPSFSNPSIKVSKESSSPSMSGKISSAIIGKFMKASPESTSRSAACTERWLLAKNCGGGGFDQRCWHCSNGNPYTLLHHLAPTHPYFDKMPPREPNFQSRNFRVVPRKFD